MTARAAQIAHDIRVGTAGWSLPTTVRDRFPSGDSLLARYAQGLSLVEINSSFYRPHRRATYARWAASTPEDFRFAVKAPRTVTHERRLVEVGTLLDRFFDEIAGLGGKLGPVLIQLPPSLPFETAEAGGFLATWRRRFVGETALEPRHPGWFTPEAEGLLVANQIARVAADPATIPTAATPAGWPGFAYHRLHGSPVIYESGYGVDRLERLAENLAAPAYIVFDNTKFGAATQNALSLQGLLTRPSPDLST